MPRCADLVDELLLDRADGLYWRIGGPVAVEPPPAERVQRVAAYGLARDGDRVLLTRLRRGAEAGRWTLPGGGLEFGERPRDAVVRELREETGLDVAVGELLDGDAELYRDPRPGHRYEAHAVRFLYAVTVLGGRLGVVETDGSTDDARWWPVTDPPPMVPIADRVLRTGRLGP